MSSAPQERPGRGATPGPDAGEPPVVRDRRRVRMDGTVTTPDDETAGAHTPSAAGPTDAPAATTGRGSSGSAAIDRIDELQAQVERLAGDLESRAEDLMRQRADFQNYRRRRDREVEAAGVTAVTAFVAALFPVLDDIDRAREHEQMSAGFRSVADGLEQQVAKAGVTRFGQPGDPFDPTIHEALMHGFSEEVDAPTATVVVQAGYRVGDRVVRPARVMVMEPPADNAVQESLDTEGAGVAEGAPLGDSTTTGDSGTAGDGAPGDGRA